MSYQVLARKWRPRVFREMVGQEHVLQALINALDRNRLHHAYLFTGTRGVGKTTIARILAKCLNCETGVSSEPCGQCASCREIAEGRFVDLIEVDAASRTKVEDTRDLLENVQYAPTRGRYKVYLIDEVHMLSNSSFNALLKTLEEPPPHVKFLLATTDPQKLPMTILSRCLQFNLKNMNPERIVQHLKYVLEQELVPFEESALWQLGRAADGSMRDAMSLTDQAIAYGSGKITESEVSTMLGTIDQASVYEIVTALMSLDGRALLGAVEAMSEHAPDYASALAEMLSVLHRIAIAQALPEAVDNSQGDREAIMKLAQQVAPEDVQLFYQMALLGRRDLPLAPDPRAGFEMVLLRMLAFKPQGVMDLPTQALPSTPSGPSCPVNAPVSRAQGDNTSQSVSSAKSPAGAQQVASTPAAATAPVTAQSHSGGAHTPRVPESMAPAASRGAPTPQSQPVNELPPVSAASVVKELPPFDGPYNHVMEEEITESSDSYDEYAQVPAYLDLPPSVRDPISQEVAVKDRPEDEVPVPKKSEAALPLESVSVLPTQSLRKVLFAHAGPPDWIDIYLGLGVTGILQSTVANCQLVSRQGNEFHFVLDEANSTLYDAGHQQRLADLLSDYFAETVRVHITLGKLTTETPAMMAIRLRAERLQQAVDAIQDDPVVQQLMAQFGAVICEDSIQPVG